MVSDNSEGALTKRKLVDLVYEYLQNTWLPDLHLGKVDRPTREDAAGIVESFLEIVKETLARGERVNISGFGKFEIRHKKARLGRNPQTGEEITIKARKVLTFKSSQVLKKAMNQGATERR